MSQKLDNIAHLLLVPIIDDDKHIIGYYIPFTELGKASRKTTDMHMKIFQPDLVILIQFLHAAMRNMLYINLQENAKNHGVEFYQCVRRFMRLFCGHRMSQAFPKPESGEFTRPILSLLPYVTKDMARQGKSARMQDQA